MSFLLSKSFSLKEKIIIIIFVLTLLCASLSIIGYTYAFFRGNVSGTGRDVITKTANLSIKFIDNNLINLSDVIPGEVVTKTFAVENTGDVPIVYKIFWQNLTNNLGDKTDLTYSITSTNDGGSLSSTQVPSTGNNINIINGVTIEPGVTQTYTVTITFRLTSDNQDDNRDKQVSGKIGISETGNMSKNYYVNGDLELNNNTNFASFTYDSTNNWLTYTTSDRTTLVNGDFVPVEPDNTYFFTAECKASNTTSAHYLGFAEADVDKLIIQPYHVMYVNNSLTTLTQDLKNGDTVVHFNDLSSWSVSSSTPSHQLSLIFWNYKDSTGYQYPAKTYSRNYYSNLYTYDKVNKSNNTITLTSPWNKGTIPAGTSVSQGSSGGTYNYSILSYKTLTTSFKKYTATISGTNNTGSVVNNKFRAGTKYVKFMMLPNYNSVANTTIYIKQYGIHRVMEV